MMHTFDHHELRMLRALNSPRKIQDFLGAIPMNFDDDSCLSPRRVLRERRAHCMEGAMLAAAALRLQGYPPLVMELRSTTRDDDHVLALFREEGFFGAISKTNHGVLRYREPIYRSIRELALSFFHEYFLDDGRKTLRSYSIPLDLARFDRRAWMTAEEDVWYVPRTLERIRHFPLLTRPQIRRLRRADPIERQIGTIVEWSPTASRPWHPKGALGETPHRGPR